MKNNQLDRIELMLRKVLENQASLAGNQIRIAEVHIARFPSEAVDKVIINSNCIIKQVRQCLGS